MELIDTHQHLIYRHQFGYGWTNDIPALSKGDFTTKDYSALTTGESVIGSIFMEAAVDDADYQAEARFVSDLVGTNSILGQIASCRPEEDLGFDAWIDECSALNVVGFRRILHESPDDLSQSATFRENLRKIGKAGLPFDICMLARQLPLTADLVRQCDDQVFVLDHCGVPDIAANAFEEWAAGIDAVSALPNVNVKLSGIAAYCAPGTVSTETLQPWVDRILEKFGPDRMVWGSDWPVVNLGDGLPNWLEMSRQLLSPLSPTEQSKITVSNAKKIYNV